MSDELDFLHKEIDYCDGEVIKAIKTAEEAIQTRDLYSKRKQFLIKIIDLIEK